MSWIKVTDDRNFPHISLDSCTDDVLVYVKKQYAPHIFIGYYDYEVQHWYIPGIPEAKWEVTHWQPLPEDPE